MIFDREKCQNDACNNRHRLQASFIINGTQRYNFCCYECLLVKLKELARAPENRILSTQLVK